MLLKTQRFNQFTTSVQEINQLTTSVQNLVILSKLSSEVGRPLIAELNAAESSLNSGKTNKATVKLRIFIIEVDIYIDSGMLTNKRPATD